MGSSFTIEANIPEVVYSLKRLASDQIPFATSLALNLTLKESQSAVRASLPQQFTIRRPWVVTGVQVQPSSKTRLWGVIGQRDPFMALQETGGTKRPLRKAIAIPVGRLARKARTSVLRRSERPAAQMRKKTVYRGETRRGEPAIIRRGTRGKRQEVLYRLVGQARIDRRFGFESTVTRTVRSRWEANFGAALSRAIKSAR